MRTLIRQQIWNILQLFYDNRNTPLHLREISRRIKLGEGPLTRHLKYLSKTNILKHTREANLKKYYVNPKQIPKIFPIYDAERLDELPLLRKNAIKNYMMKAEKKPILLILFGSTAKKTYKQNSDIDLLEVQNQKTDNKKAREYAEAQTGIKINMINTTYKEFIEELTQRKDHVIQAAIETGYPIYNKQFYYEVLNERI